MTYTLQVDIPSYVYRKLRLSGYKLCVAKKVNAKYRVVWSGELEFSQHNIFQWEEKYQVFGTKTFAQGDTVEPFTEAQDISFGQTCVLSGETLEPATGTPDDSGTFYVQDRDRSVGVGVHCYLGSFTPITVALGLEGLMTFTPATALLVWFDLSLTTSMIFYETISNSVEVLYAPGTTSRTIIFDGNWSIDDQLGHAIAQPRRFYNSSIGFKDTSDPSDIVPPLCVLLAYGTRLALNRDANSETAVVGDEYRQSSPDQEWKLVSSSTEGHFNIEGHLGATYLSIDGEPKAGTAVIHGPQRMDWNIELLDNAIRISVPDTDYCVELGEMISLNFEKKVHKIVLAKQANEKRELWTIQHYPSEATTKQ